MAEKGYEFAEVNSSVEALPGGPKLVKVVFDVQEGPQVKVRTINFEGNEAVGDGTLKKQMKSTKEHWFLSWISGRGKYQEAKFEEDADHIVEYYRNRGYVQARVGQPNLKVLEDSPDKETRWVQLTSPWTRATLQGRCSLSTATVISPTSCGRVCCSRGISQRESASATPDQVAGDTRRRLLEFTIRTRVPDGRRGPWPVRPSR
jgi:hypothetical protein